MTPCIKCEPNATCPLSCVGLRSMTGGRVSTSTDTDTKYYIQRAASGCVGNCLLWWRKGGDGYTLDVDDAQVFDRAAANELVRDDKKYVAWEKDYIDCAAGRHVDHQNVSKKHSGFTDDH